MLTEQRLIAEMVKLTLDRGVEDIKTIRMSPEELFARVLVINRRGLGSGVDRVLE